MQGVIKSYDPGSGDGVVLCDTDFKEYDLAPDALEGSVFRMLRQGQRVIFDLDDATRATRLRLGSEVDMGTPGFGGHPGHPRQHRLTPHRRRRRTMPATTSNQKLKDWVDHWAAVLQPDAIEWCDGSEEEWDRLTTPAGRRRHVHPPRRRASGPTASSPCPTPATSPASRTAPSSAPSARPTPAPPTTGGPPAEMKAELLELYTGAMRGRTMYVVPFSMGPLGSPIAHIGVQLSDSAYVAVNMRIMTRMGQAVLDVLGADGDFVPCVHSVGYPLVLADGTTRPDVPWPCDAENKYIAHFPETREIWSYGSGYGGNALLGKKCFALRIASTMARDDGWMAEHMLVLGITQPRRARRPTSPRRSRRPAARRTWR